MQFEFMKGKGNSEAIFIVRQNFRVNESSSILASWIWKKHLTGFQEK